MTARRPRRKRTRHSVRQSWKLREQRVLDETFARTFGDWTDKDWEYVDNLFRKSVDS